MGVPAFQALAASKKHEIIGIVTQPDKPVGRHQKLSSSQIKQVALEKGIKIFQPENINTDETLKIIQDLHPDVIIVCAYGQILKKALLGIAPKGCINIHASLLPKHRGAACIPAAIRVGDRQTGVTIMQVKEELDAGDILLQKAEPIRNDDTSESLQNRLANLAPQLLLETLDVMTEGKLSPKKQDSSQATYAPKLKKEDGLIRWDQTASEIEHHIRAMIPWPTAYAFLESQMLKIFSVKVQPQTCGKAGEIVDVGKNKILVAAGEGGLLLQEVQLEGKKKMSIEEFLRGHSLTTGQIFR